MHRLLQRQLKKFLGIPKEEDVPEELRRFVSDVSGTYEENDRERRLLERVNETNAAEINRYKEQEKELELAKEQLSMMESFRRFVPRQFLEFLGKDDIREVALGDSTRSHLTVLFTDIRGFTTLSERMTVEENFRFLNAYLRRMEPAIQGCSGFIDKFVGDAIMALFPPPGHADHGVQAAVAMRQALDGYNVGRAREGFPPIHMGIGLNSGAVMLGTVGSPARMDTTVIGDPVNLASRLESLTKGFGAGILISQDTFAALEDPRRYHLRDVGTVKVVGKDTPVRICEVYDPDPEEVVAAKDRTAETFAGGLAAYRAGRFVEAGERFGACVEGCAEDDVARKYIERCEFLDQQPPDPDWQGVTEMRHK
ncbi:MAG: adenylate/guanylate cyclase domain-containing protein [Planctomycetes bacterium]|nr:adenylate/guanylate cyclase domain-containing protein [Planctomycetota bacterium]